MPLSKVQADQIFEYLKINHQVRRADEGWDIIHHAPATELQKVGFHPVARLRMDRVPNGFAVSYALGWTRRMKPSDWKEVYTQSAVTGDDHLLDKALIERHLHCLDDVVAQNPNDGAPEWEAKFRQTVEAVAQASGIRPDGPPPQRSEPEDTR